MRIQQNSVFSGVIISIVTALAIFLVSSEGDAQNPNVGKPKPFEINFLGVFPVTNPFEFPLPFSEGPGQGLAGCGSWVGTGAIDDEGRVTSEEMHFFGPFTPSGYVGLVGERDTFESDTNGSFVIDAMVLLDSADSSHQGPCTFKGGSGDYANLRGGNCTLTGTFVFVGPGDAADARCFDGAGCPGPLCVLVEQTYSGKVAVDGS